MRYIPTMLFSSWPWLVEEGELCTAPKKRRIEEEEEESFSPGVLRRGLADERSPRPICPQAMLIKQTPGPWTVILTTCVLQRLHVLRFQRTRKGHPASAQPGMPKANKSWNATVGWGKISSQGLNCNLDKSNPVKRWSSGLPLPCAGAEPP